MNGKFLLKQKAKEFIAFQHMLLVTVFLLLGVLSVHAQSTATVTTDKDDYSPGQYVIVTGTGWQPGESVSFDFHETPQVCTSDHHVRSTIAKEDGSIFYDQFLINEKHLGVAFVLTATGQSSGQQAVTHFTDAGLRNVSVAGSSFCAGEIVIVSFEAVSAGQGNFVDGNIFIAQLSNASGSFASPINIGQVPGKHKNNELQTIDAVIPSFTASGSGYRIRVISTNVEVVGPNNGANLTISAKPTVANAGSDQLDAVGTSTTLEGNAPAVGTGTWSIVSGQGGSFGTTGAVTSSNPSATFSGLIGETYTLRWTISNGACESSIDDVKIKFNKIQTSTSIINASATYGDPSVTLTSTVSPNPGGGTVEFYVNEELVGTGVVGENGIATINYNPSNLNASSINVQHTIKAKFLGVGNYTESASSPSTLTILKANQTITWNNPEPITYGTALSGAQLNASALENAALTYTPAAGTLLNAGENQTLTVTAAETNNYKAATASVKINVAKAMPAVSLAVGGPYTYDGTAKSVSSASVTGLGNADLGAATVTYKMGDASVEAPVNAGEYEVLASFAGTNNYESASANGKLVIEKAKVTLMASDLNGKVYNGSAQGITVTTSPIELNSGVNTQYSRGGIAVPASEVVNAGSYTFIASLEHQNYAAETINGSFTIGQATLTIRAEDASKIYGDQNPNFVASVVNGSVKGESFSVTASSVANSGSDVGDYPIIPAVTGTTLDNYTIVKHNGTLTISERPITVTANSGQIKVYGESDPAAYTYHLTSGSLVSANHLTGALGRVAGDHVGTYAIKIGTLAATNNYALTYVGADFEITRRQVIVTADALSKVYGDSDPVLTYKVSFGSVVSGDDFSGALKRIAGESVSTYAVELGSLSLGNNYSLSLTEGTVFSITPKAITVTPVAGQSKVYGSNEPALAYNTNTDLVGDDVFTGALSRSSGENVGPYPITKGSLALNDNYTLSVVETVTFQITPKALVASIAADDKVYDGTTTASATGSVPAADLVNGDVVTVNVSDANFDTKNAGTNKTVSASVSIDHPNYSLSNARASTTASITPKAITGEFAAANKVYDGTDAATITARSLVGVVGQDKVELTGGTATFSDKNVADGKNVTLAGAILYGEDKGNYSLSKVSTAKADITPKAASVSPIAGTKVYGTADPALSGTTAGFLEADGITASYTRAPGERVANYTISATLSPAAALGNYDVTYNTAQFEITKAKLAVIADDKSKVYGDANPVFTGTITGIKNNDAIVASYKSAATASSVIGDYAIEPSLTGDALDNYDVTLTNGKLSITKAAIAVVANDKTRIYGIANPVLDGALTGVKNNDAITANYSTVADEASNVGDYAITVTLNDPDGKLENYTISNTPGKLSITQAPATITVADLNKVYNRTAQGATVTTSPANLEVIVKYNGSSVTPTAAGSYAVVAKLNNSNYSADEVLATFVIARKEVTATLAHAGKVYDGTTAAPGTTATLDGVISPDNVTTNVTGGVFNDANAGDRTVTATVVLAGDDKANYKLQSVTPASATISPRAVTVAADAKSKVYGDNDPALTYSLKAGSLVEGELFSGELKREAGEDVGSYNINQNTLTAGNNYSITYEAAKLAITPKAITIAAVAKSKTYGDVDPALTYTITTGALVYNDAFTGSLTRAGGEDVGSYAITQGSLALSNNYALTYQGANLSITPLSITVTADAQQKYCGQADPALTFVSSPVVGAALANGAQINFAGSLSRAIGESVGAYAIGQGTLSNSNYTISYIPANLDILGIAVDASASSKPVAVGSSASLSATVSTGATGVGAVPVTFTVMDETNKVVFTKTISTDGSGVATETIPSSVLALGVYKVEAVAGTGCATSNAYIPVFDASGSFVTGGGWINSPEGALVADRTVVGKANFGFVSKYKKGSSQVDGNTEFQFTAGSINFKSTMHDSGSLVIAGGKATYRGTGTINGISGYKFTIVAIDSELRPNVEADQFRIKIVDSKNQTVYDNGLGAAENGDVATTLGNNGTGGGSIVIHEAKEVAAKPSGKKLETADQLEGLSSARFDNYPNAFSDRTTIRFAFDTEEQFALEVYDVRGSLIKKVATGKAEAGQIYEYELDARNLAEGVYIARLITGSKAQSIKMILKK